MNNPQFQILIQELQIIKNDIIEKLEEVRCGLIDIESEVEKNQAQPEDSAGSEVLTESVTQPEIEFCPECGTPLGCR